MTEIYYNRIIDSELAAWKEDENEYFILLIKKKSEKIGFND